MSPSEINLRTALERLSKNPGVYVHGITRRALVRRGWLSNDLETITDAGKVILEGREPTPNRDNARYREWRARCKALEHRIAELRARPDPHDTTIEYLLNTAEACAKCADLLAEMRDKPADVTPEPPTRD